MSSRNANIEISLLLAWSQCQRSSHFHSCRASPFSQFEREERRVEKEAVHHGPVILGCYFINFSSSFICHIISSTSQHSRQTPRQWIFPLRLCKWGVSYGSKPACPITILRSFQNNTFNFLGGCVVYLPLPPFFKKFVLQQKGIRQCYRTNGLYGWLYKTSHMQRQGSSRLPIYCLVSEFSLALDCSLLLSQQYLQTFFPERG